MCHTGPQTVVVVVCHTDKQTTPIYHNALVPLHFITWHTFYPHPITPPLSGPHNPARRVTRSHVFHTGAPVSMQPHRQQIRAVNNAFWTSARHKVPPSIVAIVIVFVIFSHRFFSFSLFFVFVNFWPSLKMTSLMTSSMLELGLGLHPRSDIQTVTESRMRHTDKETNKQTWSITIP